MLGGQAVIGRRHEAARTAAAGSGNTSFPGRRRKSDRRRHDGDRAGHRHPPGRVQQLLDPAGVNTLEILQELGFTCHIDDLSADEPFLRSINGQPFATVPYKVHLNDSASLNFPASTRPVTSSSCTPRAPLGAG
jgi:hypothetical protein